MSMFLKYNFFALSWIIFIVIVMLVPGNETLQEVTLGIYFQGFLYCVLSILMAIGFRKQNDYPLIRFNAITISTILLIVMAVLLETLQIWIPYRYFYIWDLIGSIVGVLLGQILYYFIYKA